MNDGYTYTAITGSRDEPVRIEVSFYLDADARIRLYGPGGDRPQLGIAHGHVEVTIHPEADQITDEDSRIARDLADKATAYAAEIERLRAEHAPRAAIRSAA